MTERDLIALQRRRIIALRATLLRISGSADPTPYVRSIAISALLADDRQGEQR